MVHVQLSEWDRADPSTHKELRGLTLELTPALRGVVDVLKCTERFSVTELRHGIEITTTSFVGSLQLGDLHIVITPKIDFDVLISLFRYAYGLHDLHQLSDVSHKTSMSTFQDLLIQQLGSEVAGLLARGIHRQYFPVTERLSSPRGKIDVTAVVRESGYIADKISCAHYPRLEDNVLNRLLLTGTRFAAWLTGNRTLRTHLLQLVSRLEADVATIPLDGNLLAQARRALSRLTSAYEPAITLIELLYGGAGVSWQEDERTPLRLPGFLFDMNRFFEALVTRFLSENLRGFTVRAQHKLAGMMAYRTEHNPLRRRAPTPRPDIAVIGNAAVVKLLDTKYRDLWENPLPRDMLYQLAIYALSQPKPGEAVILYPSMNRHARQQVVDIREPTTGAHGASVILRSINLAEMVELIIPTGAQAERARVEYAEYLIGLVK